MINSNSAGFNQRGAKPKHGLCKHPLYTVYHGIKKRCYYEKHNQYHRYGGRGITICDRWLESFENFFEDVSEGYEKGLQLDRINNDGDYEPSNVRWVTKQQNDFNRGSRPNSSSKFKGVSWNTAKNMWVAQIYKDGKHEFLGYFFDESDAATCYNNRAVILFGNNAHINKVEIFNAESQLLR